MKANQIGIVVAAGLLVACNSDEPIEAAAAIKDAAPGHGIDAGGKPGQGGVTCDGIDAGGKPRGDGIDAGGKPRGDGIDAGGKPRGEGIDAGGKPTVDGIDAGGKPGSGDGIDAGGKPCVGDGIDAGGKPGAGDGIDAGGKPGSGDGIDAGGKIGATIATGVLRLDNGLVVDGVKYDTSNALFSINRRAGSQSELANGQVVTVLGDVNRETMTGEAWQVSFESLVSGPVQAMDAESGQFVVLGQTVRSGDTAAELRIGAIVEVSGFVADDGHIDASFVGPATREGFLVAGVATNVDASRMTLEINGLRVAWQEAWFDGFPQGLPEEGQRVEVRGTAVSRSGELHADSILND